MAEVDPISSLGALLADSPEVLLEADSKVQDAARTAVKYFLDPVAKEYSAVFKNGIYVDGLDTLQIWEQARLVLDGVAEKVLFNKYETITKLRRKVEDEDELENIAKRRKLAGEISDSDNSEESAADDDADEDEDNSDEEDIDEIVDDEDGGDDDEDDEDEEADETESLAADIASHLTDEEAERDDRESEFSDNEEHRADKFVKDTHGLNDGFFDIDEFNRMTEAAELNGQSEDDDDDEEEIDYFADPEDQVDGNVKHNNRTAQKDDSEDSEDEDDYDEDDIEGVFGSIGQRAKPRASEENANEIRYEDFFAPPRGKRGQSKQPKSHHKKFSGLGEEDDDDVLEEAMSEMKKDLFEDDGEEEEDEQYDDEGNKMSTFEKKQRKLQNQIRQLEEENVSKKSWTVMGEARASARPHNSLLEEDMEFDRGAKPVPVITTEVTETLEDLIRKRIKEEDFDDLPRRTADSMPEFRASRLLDVDQSKSSKSLAELYEEDHMKAAAGEDAHAPVDQKLEKAHEEIRELFADISYKLDALSSWHFRPKPAQTNVTIIANTGAVTMEDAQPATMSTENMLAPQEVYIPLEGIEKGKEVVTGTGLVVSREEMSREEKKRRRRREKARYAKKQERKEVKRSAAAAGKPGGRADVVETLKRGKVTVLGKRGERMYVDGRRIQDKRVERGVESMKL
ncbi:U3 small nucleolar ribonucleoprotein complex, subunit Mpp10 [Lipomyces oligophaga]|uniref:U3 small nucleolar ribonucleoprotein complex, subunit Mpp10 n=1 Tax=Lipomyces oligophaga TaxID=45792 RepID=UPI0034CDE243